MRKIGEILVIIVAGFIDFADPCLPSEHGTDAKNDFGESESDREMGASKLRNFPQVGNEDLGRRIAGTLQSNDRPRQRDLARGNGNNIFSLAGPEGASVPMNMMTREQGGSGGVLSSFGSGRMGSSGKGGMMMGSNGKGGVMGSGGKGGMNQPDFPGKGLPPGKGKGIDDGQGCWIVIGGSGWGGGSKSKKGSPKGSWWNWASHHGPHKVWDPYCRHQCIDPSSSKSKKGSKSGKGKGKGGSKSKTRPCPIIRPTHMRPMPSPPRPTMMMRPTPAPIQMMPPPTQPVRPPTRRPTSAPTRGGTVAPSVAPNSLNGTRAPSPANGTTTAPATARNVTAAPV
jgi:hypothetical protein